MSDQELVKVRVILSDVLPESFWVVLSEEEHDAVSLGSGRKSRACSRIQVLP